MSSGINEEDEDGDTPLKLAIQNNAGTTVALVIFYCPKDLEGTGRKLLGLSIRLRLFAAIKAAPDFNATDSE